MICKTDVAFDSACWQSINPAIFGPMPIVAFKTMVFFNFIREHRSSILLTLVKTTILELHGSLRSKLNPLAGVSLAVVVTLVTRVISPVSLVVKTLSLL